MNINTNKVSWFLFGALIYACWSFSNIYKSSCVGIVCAGPTEIILAAVLTIGSFAWMWLTISLFMQKGLSTIIKDKSVFQGIQFIISFFFAYFVFSY